MRYLLLIILVAFLSGCFVTEPIKTEVPVNNETYRVDYLFEHEGCKVYRFYDRGESVYFTNCTGEAIRKTDSTTIRNTINQRGGR